jgi:hypothetical protein
MIVADVNALIQRPEQAEEARQDLRSLLAELS